MYVYVDKCHIWSDVQETYIYSVESIYPFHPLRIQHNKTRYIPRKTTLLFLSASLVECGVIQLGVEPNSISSQNQSWNFVTNKAIWLGKIGNKYMVSGIRMR